MNVLKVGGCYARMASHVKMQARYYFWYASRLFGLFVVHVMQLMPNMRTTVRPLQQKIDYFLGGSSILDWYRF
jgi:hypothetical protein